MGDSVARVMQVAGVVLLLIAIGSFSILWKNLGLARGTEPGVRLVYEVNAPPGASGRELAEDMARALTRRVDPHGTSGITIRSQRDGTIEVQAPTKEGRNGQQIDDLKRMLRGNGVLTFHIMVDDPGELSRMNERLKAEGPTPKNDDISRWFEVDKAQDFHRSTVSYGGKQWALAWITPDKSMVHNGTTKPWRLRSAYRTFDSRTNAATVGFEFDPQGGMLFGDLSGSNIGKALAIALDDRIISAPNLNSRVEGSGIITGNFSDAEIQYMVNTLDAGSLPAKLGDKPIREQAAEVELRPTKYALPMAGLLAMIGVGGLALLVLPLFLRRSPLVPPPLPPGAGV
ncbi:MAG: hypothetical protein ACHRHE_01025 [Tepidisphaerales bacterium]